MRILFVMAYPGYLRYFDSTIGELSRRGNDVHVYFEKLKKQSEGLVGLEGLEQPVTMGGAIPGHTTSWTDVARALRTLPDYLRYLDPLFRESAYLRRRVAQRLPRGFGWLGRVEALPSRLVQLAIRSLQWLERGIPSAPRIDAFLEELEPDIVVLSPLLTVASRQNDLLAAAKRRRIPVVAAIASWDHLTTKGLLRPYVDRVLVWNEAQ